MRKYIEQNQLTYKGFCKIYQQYIWTNAEQNVAARFMSATPLQHNRKKKLIYQFKKQPTIIHKGRHKFRIIKTQV
jgi:hypothetical protein